MCSVYLQDVYCFISPCKLPLPSFHIVNGISLQCVIFCAYHKYSFHIAYMSYLTLFHKCIISNCMYGLCIVCNLLLRGNATQTL